MAEPNPYAAPQTPVEPRPEPGEGYARFLFWVEAGAWAIVSFIIGPFVAQPVTMICSRWRYPGDWDMFVRTHLGLVFAFCWLCVFSAGTIVGVTRGSRRQRATLDKIAAYRRANPRG